MSFTEQQTFHRDKHYTPVDNTTRKVGCLVCLKIYHITTYTGAP